MYERRQKIAIAAIVLLLLAGLAVALGTPLKNILVPEATPIPTFMPPAVRSDPFATSVLPEESMHQVALRLEEDHPCIDVLGIHEITGGEIEDFVTIILIPVCSVPQDQAGFFLLVQDIMNSILPFSKDSDEVLVLVVVDDFYYAYEQTVCNRMLYEKAEDLLTNCDSQNVVQKNISLRHLVQWPGRGT